LLFFTQGFSAYDSAFEKIEGADSLNCCSITLYSNYNNGINSLDAVLILKQPDTENKYSIFHKAYEFPTPQDNSISDGLRETKIVIEADTLRGISKDIVQYPDSLYGVGLIEACRHANGRDWWIVQKHYIGNRFFVYLFDHNGLHIVHDIPLFGYLPSPYTQAVFSPDGSKYIIAGNQNFFNDSMFVAKYDFDRCTGMLSNPEFLYWQESPYSISSGCAISPNSKYLYVSGTLAIYQFDITQANWQSTKTLVATYDGFSDTLSGSPWNTSFALMQLAPDGKIYMPGGNTHYLHTIDNPDEQGLACNVCQHCFQLPSKHKRTVSNFPNYRLGPIDGSPCDTLGIDNITNINDKLDNNTEPVRLYPNPATDYITLFIPRITKQWQFALFDIQGREVLHVNSRGAFRSLDVSQLAAGLYLWKLVYEDGKEERGKLILQR
jgi:hypothetical protein